MKTQNCGIIAVSQRAVGIGNRKQMDMELGTQSGATTIVKVRFSQTFWSFFPFFCQAKEKKPTTARSGFTVRT